MQENKDQEKVFVKPAGDPIKRWRENPKLYIADCAHRFYLPAKQGAGLTLYRQWRTKQRELKREYELSGDKAHPVTESCLPFTARLYRVGKWDVKRTCKQSWVCPWCWGRAISTALFSFSQGPLANNSASPREAMMCSINLNVDHKRPMWESISAARRGLTDWLKTENVVDGVSILGVPVFQQDTVIAKFGVLVVLKRGVPANSSVFRGAATIAMAPFGTCRVFPWEPTVADQLHVHGPASVFAYPRKSVLSMPASVLRGLLDCKPKGFRLFTNLGVFRPSIGKDVFDVTTETPRRLSIPYPTDLRDTGSND